jgi:GABA(A) receptor-associated protein
MPPKTSSTPETTATTTTAAGVKYRQRVSMTDRKISAERIMTQHPSRIPVVVECSEQLQQEHPLSKNKFAVPYDLTLAQFLFVIRKHMKLQPEYAIYAFVNNRLHPTTSAIGTIYAQEKMEDGFMYIDIFQESTFGSTTF